MLTLILALHRFRPVCEHRAVARAPDCLPRRSRLRDDEIGALQAEVDRLKALLLSEPQVLVSWAAAAEQPEILGDTAIIAPGSAAERVLAFGTWLEAAAAHRMEQAVDTLRREGRGFV